MIDYATIDLILKTIMIGGSIFVFLALLISVIFALMIRFATTNRGPRSRH